MPFVQRVVEPRNLSRTSLRDERGADRVDDGELEAVANNTLSNALRQLASLVLAATDVFAELTLQLDDVGERSKVLKTRMDAVETALGRCDPKKVPVPESDICTFAARGHHYKSRHPTDSTLFTPATRPAALRALYEAAVEAPGGGCGGDGASADQGNTSRAADGTARARKPSLIGTDGILLCTPVLGARRRRQAGKIDAEIEQRLPAAVEELRRWTSAEALGDVTVTPDCVTRVVHSTSAHVQDHGHQRSSSADDLDGAGVCSGDDTPLDHKLPSPEEQLQAVALKFPAVMVAVDVTGRRFDRMSRYRRTTTGVGCGGRSAAGCSVSGPATAGPSTSQDPATATTGASTAGGSVRRRSSRARKPRGKRRNTIAGTDRDEIQQAINGDRSVGSPKTASPAPPAAAACSSSSPTRQHGRSQSGDPLKSSVKRSHFSTLKQWGKTRLRMMNRSNGDVRNSKVSEIEDINLYETVTAARVDTADQQQNQQQQQQQQQQRKYSSSSDKSSAAAVVRMREGATQRRNRDEPHSSSGNWSASSESGRASIGSETTTTQPRSTPTISGSSCLAPGSAGSRRRFADTSASCSEGTLTPDIASHVDDETSSAYSCDTEGYYTSFHVDSGLKTLREEDSLAPVTPLHCSNALHSGSGGGASGESEYELFGRGSTSTTTSSAGTVCTALRASGSDRSLVIGPAVPERKSSLTKLDRSGSSSSNVSGTLDRCGTIKRNGVLLKKEPATPEKSQGAESPDSGHNTSSSPIESAASPNGCSEFSSELSESSDAEGTDRAERIRVKTAINSSRIPSMCAITPPPSDEEQQPAEDAAAKRVVLAPIPGTSTKLNLINVDSATGYATVETVDAPRRTSHENVRTTTLAALKRSPLMPLLGRLRGVLPGLKKSPVATKLDMNDEYVTIADVRNNNEKPSPASSLARITTTAPPEYVSLDELPRGVAGVARIDSGRGGASPERRRAAGQGARVTVDAEGRVVYSSDSLKRNKAHSTFEPGPCVKKVLSAGGKLVIRAGGSAERVRAVVTPNGGGGAGRTTAGAYVNLGDDASEHPSTLQSTDQKLNMSITHVGKESDDAGRFCAPTNPFQHKNPLYWTLQSTKSSVALTKRSLTPEMKHHPNISNAIASETFPAGISDFSPIKSAENGYIYEEKIDNISNSFKISPIDPRSTNSFQSSTPSRSENPVGIVRNQALNSKMKSTMTNDELYAIIHKSKKKLNIKNDSESPQGCTTYSQISRNCVAKGRSSNSWSVSEGNANGLISELKIPQIANIAGERQSWACSDRLGPSPKTSRLDFKRLLLQHGSKMGPISQNSKLSAVEQLKLDRQNKEKNNLEIRNPMNVLDLSSSPKSFGNRRSISRLNQNLASPINHGNKDLTQRNSSKMVSPRSAWRFANPRSDVLSSPIQEACSEEDVLICNIGAEKLNISTLNAKQITTRPMTIKAGPILAYPNLMPIPESESSPNKQTTKATKPNENCFKDNIFLKIEENNFMKSELIRNTKPLQPLTRSQSIQAQRAQFLTAGNIGQSQITAQFKNGHYTGTISSQNIVKTETVKPSSPTLETAL